MEKNNILSYKACKTTIGSGVTAIVVSR